MYKRKKYSVDILISIQHVPKLGSYLLNTKDKQLILTLLKKRNILDWIHPELKNDREFILEAVKNSYPAFLLVNMELRGDREIVLTAVKQNGLTLQYANETLYSDREIVLSAVKSCGLALKYASTELCADREIVFNLLNFF